MSWAEGGITDRAQLMPVEVHAKLVHHVGRDYASVGDLRIFILPGEADIAASDSCAQQRTWRAVGLVEDNAEREPILQSQDVIRADNETVAVVADVRDRPERRDQRRRTGARVGRRKEGAEQLAEVAVRLPARQRVDQTRRGHQRRGRLQQGLAVSFIASEKEVLVLPDRASDHQAKLVQAERRRARRIDARNEVPCVAVVVVEETAVEEVAGVEGVVAHVLPEGGVKRVAAALGDDCDVGSGDGPELGAFVAGDDVEFLDGIGWHASPYQSLVDAGAGNDQIVVVATVDGEVVEEVVGAVYEASGVAGVAGTRTGARVEYGGGAGLEADEIREGAAIQGQIGKSDVVHDSADGGVGGRNTSAAPVTNTCSLTSPTFRRKFTTTELCTCTSTSVTRSEERRVGKECRSRW